MSVYIVKEKERNWLVIRQLKDDVINSGSNYVNQFVVKDDNLIPFRNPNNLSHFF
ncbi:hypothetical protein [Candidatus Coxiella mudrowiae]|uniref:hypothetical protein n=1 Tax=Candidatus Coxiella mudrowiae TaxID=2054173 RepID=UPI003CC83521